MSTKVFGVEILLRSSVAADSDIGLYANVDDSNSGFRWIQNSISGVSGWKEGIIAKGGIGNYNRKIDLLRGGNVASAGNGRISVKNVLQGSSKKFYEEIRNKDIYFNGLICNIYLFTDDSESVQWRGVCEEPTWDTRTYTIPLRGLTAKRTAQAGTQITEINYPHSSEKTRGKYVPITFGDYRIVMDKINVAKLVRVNDNKNTYIEQWFTGGAEQNTRFPVKRKKTNTKYNCGLACGRCGTKFDTLDVSDDDIYVEIIDGSGAGGKKKVIEFTGFQDGFDFEVDQAFTDALETTGSKQSVVQFSQMHRTYLCDVWPCRGFINDTLPFRCSVINYSDDPVLYGVDEETKKVFRIGDKGYTAITDNNGMKIEGKYFTDNLDELTSFEIRPPKEVHYSAYPYFKTYGVDRSEYKINAMTGGVLVDSSAAYIKEAYPYINDKARDKNGLLDTYESRSSDTSGIYGLPHKKNKNKFAVFVDVVPPEYPDTETDYDSVYIVPELTFTNYHNVNATLTVECWAWSGTGYAKKLYEITGSITGLSSPAVAIHDNAQIRLRGLPSWYINNRSTDDYFVIERNGETEDSGRLSYFTGYYTFEAEELADKNYYDSISRIKFVIKKAETTSKQSSFLTIDEIAFVFAKQAKIGTDTYSLLSGRTYDDTWGGRKPSSDTIKNPIDILEHTCRLQCWDENSTTPTSGWGRGYGASALIKTSGTGSFDSINENLQTVKSYSVSRQLFTESEMYTDKIKRSICRNFFLANWVDKNGYECVDRIKRSITGTSDALTLNDIVDRQEIKIKEMPVSEIYPEPFVNYNYDFATGEYRDTIRIKNVSADSYDPDYVEGLSGSLASEYWSRCKGLWQKVRHVNKPPSDITDLMWANGIDGETIALEYLTNWIDWMYNPQIEFKAHFNTVGDWEECHRFTMQLPFQTGGSATECLLDSITIAPNPPYICTVTAIMFSETIPTDYWIKKTLLALEDSDNYYTKTLTAQGGSADITKVL